jgi:S1-C subfamily serine protease
VNRFGVAFGFVAITLLGIAAATTAGAQQRDERRGARDTPRVRIWVDGREITPRLQPLLQRRARLGITVRLSQSDTDSIGAYVESVTPGGPAARAGIRSGDIITRVKGQSVLSSPDRRVDRDESMPGVRLTELAARLEPNDTIQVEFVRDGSRRTTTLVTGDEPVVVLGDEIRMRFPDLSFLERGRESFPGRRGPELPMLGLRSPLSDLELAPLNDDLGAYFGTTEGVLVIRAPDHPTLGLKGGDVILSVDGRKATSPSSLLRILRSYEPTETFRLEIIRQKRRETLTASLRGR